MNRSGSEPNHDEADGTRIIAVCSEIIFRNDTNGYTVADFTSGNGKHESFTGVGVLPFLDFGETVVLFGKWIEHSVYGRQLLVDRYSPYHATSEKDLIRYLSSGSIPWVGPKTAQKIVERFGTDALDAIRDEPEKLTEIRGITPKKAREISAVLRQKADFQDLSLLLTPFGFGSARIMSVYRRFGANAASILRKNPYLLVSEISGIGFLTADRLARSMGYDPASAFRVGSALLYLLSVSENDGNTYIPMDDLLKRTLQLLADVRNPGGPESAREPFMAFDEDNNIGSIKHKRDRIDVDSAGRVEKGKIGTEDLLRGLSYILDSGKIVVYRIGENGITHPNRIDRNITGHRVALPKTFEAEMSAAQSLIDRSCRIHASKDEGSVKESRVAESIRVISGDLSIDLSEEQSEALVLAALSPCSVITGGPGTGKTTIVAVLVRHFVGKDRKVVLCAPTGRAAKRLSEACDYPASTIHRLLEVTHPESGGAGEVFFGRDQDNPIEADVVIVDETSMLDTVLLDALLRAVPPVCRIVFIGDKDQLPSVSAGNVLSDMIASGIIPSVRLRTIYRQAKQSRIVLSAHSVLKGGEMIFDQSLESDCMMIVKKSSEEIAEAVKRLYAHVLPEVYGINPLREAVVLCPSRKGPAGISALNPILQGEYGVLSDRYIQSGSFHFCIGDRVMQIRNDYELAYTQADGNAGQGVFNGEMGVILRLDPHAGELVVEFDDRRIVSYDSEHMEDLEPAYAITVHKSQGSEFPVVILAIPGGPPMLYNRNLLYTAITRAREKLFVITDRRTLSSMIRNTSQAERNTSLKDFMEILSREAKEADETMSEGF